MVVDIANCSLRFVVYTGRTRTIYFSEPTSPSDQLNKVINFTKSIETVLIDSGGELKIVAFLTEANPIQRILIYIGEPATPPRIAPARAPPDWLEADFDQTCLIESKQAEYEFDQTVSW